MNVLLIDDQPLILDALQRAIQGLSERVGVTAVGSAAAARAALVAQADFDLVLLGLQLREKDSAGGERDGFALLNECRQQHPLLPVVAISASDSVDDVIRAIDLGAMGYVPTRTPVETLLNALRLVMTGGFYVPPMRPSNKPAPSAEAASYAPSSLAALGLTKRQTDVLALLLQGLPNKLIARQLNLSTDTVKDHVAAVLKGLGVGTRTQAVVRVSQLSDSGGLKSLRH